MRSRISQGLARKFSLSDPWITSITHITPTPRTSLADSIQWPPHRVVANTGTGIKYKLLLFREKCIFTFFATKRIFSFFPNKIDLALFLRKCNPALPELAGWHAEDRETTRGFREWRMTRATGINPPPLPPLHHQGGREGWCSHTDTGIHYTQYRTGIHVRRTLYNGPTETPVFRILSRVNFASRIRICFNCSIWIRIILPSGCGSRLQKIQKDNVKELPNNQ